MDADRYVDYRRISWVSGQRALTFQRDGRLRSRSWRRDCRCRRRVHDCKINFRLDPLQSAIERFSGNTNGSFGFGIVIVRMLTIAQSNSPSESKNAAPARLISPCRIALFSADSLVKNAAEIGTP